MDSQTSRNVRRISKTNYLGNGLSVYLITPGNGGLFAFCEANKRYDKQ